MTRSPAPREMMSATRRRMSHQCEGLRVGASSVLERPSRDSSWERREGQCRKGVTGSSWTPSSRRVGADAVDQRTARVVVPSGMGRRAAGSAALGVAGGARTRRKRAAGPRSRTWPASTRSRPRSRDRRLPRNPEQVPAARRADPQGRAAVRSAGHRQDPARPGGRRRGGRAVLLRLGVGVHRDDRRRRGQPGPRPVRAGQEGGPVDHLHRRARRHRAGPRRRAVSSAATTSGSRPSTRSSPRWTGSPAPKASSCSPRRTGPRSSTRRCCGPAASTGASW